MARRRRRLAAPPRADRRRAEAVPQREPRSRSTTGCAPCSPPGRCSTRRRRCSASRPCSTRRRSTTSCAGGAGYAPHQDAPAYPFVDVARVVHGRGRRRDPRERLPRGRPGHAPRACCRWTTAAASRPTSSTRYEWDAGRGAGRPDAVVPLAAPRTAADPTTPRVPRRALYPTYNARVRGRPARRLLRREARRASPPRAAGPTARSRCRSSTTSRAGAV